MKIAFRSAKRPAFAALLVMFGISGTASVPALAAEPAPAVAFTDSTAAGVAGTRRVAISSVVIMFQSSVGDRAGANVFIPMITSRKDVQSVLALHELRPELREAIADAAYAALAAELKAQGFEVVPEDQVKASASYQAILKQAGYANGSRFANAMGDVLLVSPPSLPPYTAYQGEIGNFQYPSTTYLSWISGFGGKSVTTGGPSVISQANAWKVPGLEVALAKELNANVVKATYVVSLGRTDAKRSTSFQVTPKSGLFTYNGELYQGTYNQRTRTVTGSGTALAQVGLVPDQTHLAFRSPTGNAKWQKVAMTKVVPPKDGDVVVRTTAPLLGSTDWFSVREGNFKQTGGLMFSAQQRADINLLFEADVIDETGYGKELTGMIDAANQAMLALVKPTP